MQPLTEYIQEASGVGGMVTDAACIFAWINADGEEKVAVVRDGSPITIYGMLHLAVDIFRQATDQPTEELF